MKKLLLFLALVLSLNSLFAQHLRKNGMPDKRFKENRSWSTPNVSSTSNNYHTRETHVVYQVERDSKGKIKRSSAARHEFMKQTGYSHGRPGYVIDHIKPLKEGGCDCPENMQWQTKEAAKEKDKWE